MGMEGELEHLLQSQYGLKKQGWDCSLMAPQAHLQLFHLFLPTEHQMWF